MIILVIIAGMIGLIVGILTKDLFWSLWVGTGTLGILVWQALQRIPAKPPHKAQVTIFGERQKTKKEIEKEIIEADDTKRVKKELIEVSEYKDEGWRLFPLYPLWYGYIPVKVERIVFEIKSTVRTPDRSNSAVPIVLTIRPSPDYLIEYINSGGEEGVKTQLIGKIQERIREWAMSEEEGPISWRELNRAHLEAVSILIKAIAGRENVSQIPEYAQNVPTHIWMRYYSEPQPKKAFFKNEEEWIGKEEDPEKWLRVKNELKKMNDEQKKNTKEAVKKRRDEIVALRVGAAKILIQNLGIVIERLNVADIEVLGEVAKRADAQAKEQEDRDAEGLELGFVRERIEDLMKPPFRYTPEQALEIVQTERGKVEKQIAETKVNISAETRSMIERLGFGLVAQFLKKGGERHEPRR